MTLNAGLMSSTRGNWRTPKAIYEKLCGPLWDVSDTHGGTFDALKDEWPDLPFYCNPPYGKGIAQWVERMIAHPAGGVALLPARTDSRWGQRCLQTANSILFIAGRLHFDDSKNAAPFPSMLVIWHGDKMTLGMLDQIVTVTKATGVIGPSAPL